MSSSNSRRKFLKDIITHTSLTPTVYKTIMGHVLMGSFLKAIASDEDITNGNTLITLYLNGAPPRWMWDLPLQSRIGENNAEITAQKMMMNQIGNITNLSSNQYQALYSSINHNGMILPHIWNTNISTSGSSNIPMHSLADHMLFIRGVEVTSDAHNAARALQITPNPGGLSNGNITAYQSRNLSPFNAMLIGGSDDSFNLQTKGLYRVGSIRSWNLIEDVLMAFQQNFNPRIIAMDDPSNVIDNIFSAFRARVNHQGGKMNSFYNERNNAKAMMERVLNGMNENWDDLRNKYNALISANSAIDINGVTNRSLMANGSSDFLWRDGNNLNNIDLVNVIDDPNVNWNMANNFAITEFILKESLTSYLFANFNSPYMPMAGANLDMDSHFIGKLPTLVGFSRYYHHFSCCLNELKAVLEANNVNGSSVWERSLFQITTDFGRAPTADAGSEHAGKASNVTLFGGMINQGSVVGNIYTSSSYNAWPGLFGESAPVAALSNKNITLGNVSSTIAHLLGGRSPVPRDPAIVSLQNDGSLSTSVSTSNVERS